MTPAEKDIALCILAGLLVVTIGGIIELRGRQIAERIQGLRVLLREWLTE